MVFHDGCTLLSYFVFFLHLLVVVMWLHGLIVGHVLFVFLFVGLATAGTLSGLAPGAVNLSSSEIKVGFAPGEVSHLYQLPW